MSDNLKHDAIRKAIEHAKEDFADLIDKQPNLAKSEAQRDMERKHGNPRDFAKACVNAIGDISCLEATLAIRHYTSQWEAAA